MVKYNQHIPAVQNATVDQLPLRFSFKHLDLTNAKFHPSGCSVEYLIKLFEILQQFSNWRVSDFIDQNNKERRHIIDFEQTSEKDGFQNIPDVDREQFGSLEGWQFGVFFPGDWNRWRVHGILADDTFYVVWLDEKHLLYP
jgi:hypothetical protein